MNFTISGTEAFNGVDAASLKLSKGRLSGSVTVIAPYGPFACSVNAGSTDIRDRLDLTCTVGPEEIVTDPNHKINLGHFLVKNPGQFSAKIDAPSQKANQY